MAEVELMENQKDRLIVKASQALAVTHGRFFAACLLADHGVPLPVALVALRGSAQRQHSIPHRSKGRIGTASWSSKCSTVHLTERYHPIFGTVLLRDLKLSLSAEQITQ